MLVGRVLGTVPTCSCRQGGQRPTNGRLRLEWTNLVMSTSTNGRRHDRSNERIAGSLPGSSQTTFDAPDDTTRRHGDTLCPVAVVDRSRAPLFGNSSCRIAALCRQYSVLPGRCSGGRSDPGGSAGRFRAADTDPVLHEQIKQMFRTVKFDKRNKRKLLCGWDSAVARLDELHESNLQFVSLFEIICFKLSFLVAHVN